MGSTREPGNRFQQILAGERLSHKRGLLVMGGEPVAPVAADKGKGNAAPGKRIGDGADQLSGKVDVD